jgi:hypothetical protein
MRFSEIACARGLDAPPGLDGKRRKSVLKKHKHSVKRETNQYP